ncbi:NAD-dependent protein deacylase [Clostridium sp. YIM B02515]|uniref:NAD-dependent protein deacetylase n=1 Tax=Clostridium rhizosphaerae TaxID=2803861 RepID=A0ABS1TAW1_9CLOT|nr:NAD-dependent protein deacylase [Clostridium rhizosphaerae]MBL4936480.1 NAD-dependent protein deacylase [Clostridium rhizosphaerae]
MCIDRLKQIINESDNIVFFGGAGVSTESNIPDFRSNSGLYNTESSAGYKPETILSHSFFKSHTEDFYNFYKNKMIYTKAKPNKAHLALAELEEKGKLKAVVTQNIDGLHQLAGSKNVLELHGSVHRNYCIKCGKYYSLDYIMNSPTNIPRCDLCSGIVKPDVVLYEENLNMDVLSSAINYISKADTLIVGGTSLAVYPAAGLIDYYIGSKLILINKSKTPYDNKANLIFHGSISDILSSVV